MKPTTSTRLRIFMFSALAVGTLFTREAPTYQQAGHFYSIYPATGAASNLAPDERRLLAFCAQLPDQSKDLDAVAVYRAVLAHPIDWARWGTSNVADTEWVKSMVTVQQLIHVLTGGDAVEVQAMARAAVSRLFNNVRNDGDRLTNICALGMGLHMFGDSFAHQRMADKPTVMYSTGMGHAGDFSYPDYPLCDGYVNGIHVFQTCNKVTTGECIASSAKSATRFCRWLQYPASGASLMSDPARGRFDAGTDPALVTLAKDFEKSAENSNDRNHWGEDEVEGTLLKDEALPPEITTFFKAQASSNDCQVVVNAALHDTQLKLTPDGATGTSQTLSCAKIWNAYAPTIVSELANSEAAGRVIRERLDNIKWTNVYRCPLIDRKYKTEPDTLCN